MSVLAVAAELALRTGTRMLDPTTVEKGCAARGIERDACVAALLSLRQQGFVQLQVADPSTLVLLAVTNAGLEAHLHAVRPDLVALEERLAAAMRTAVGAGPIDLAGEVGEPPLLVECVLDRWVGERRIVYSKAPGRRFRIHRVLPGPAASSSEPAAG